jgi:hypothetical protein
MTKGWPRDITNFVWIIGIFVLMLMILSREAFQLARDYRLLKAGKCALGKIIAQRKVGAGRQKRSEITYQFPVGPGKPMTARGIDITNTYSPNMSIAIFYDPNDFSKNVGICCTNWRVRTKGGHLLEP